jgi:hypothetical protein
MPPKAIRKKACFWVGNPYGLSKDPRPKRHLNILRREESKEEKEFMKVQDGGVHRNKY